LREIATKNHMMNLFKNLFLWNLQCVAVEKFSQRNQW